MSKKMIKLFSILVLFLCLMHSTSVFALTTQPGKTPESNLLLNFLSPYILNAFKEKNITPSTIDYDSSTIVSVKHLPDNKFEVEVFVKTYTGNHIAPFGSNIVTLVVNNNNKVEVTKIVERAQLTSYEKAYNLYL